MATESSIPVVPSRWNLVGKTALVTGGTKGIGKAIVEELAGLGAAVYVCARSEEGVKAAVEAWKAAGLDVEGSACDVSTLDSCKQLVAAASKHFKGRLDILVNNAAFMFACKSVDVEEEFLSSVMRTNFDAGFYLSKFSYPLFKASDGASIIFISSIAGVVATHPQTTLYSVSKGAINQLTRSLACEWAEDGIRVNAVAPGYTHSDFLDNIITPENVAKINAQTPLARMGEAKEIAATVAFLCMPCSSFTTGSIFTVDGGFSAQNFL